MSNQLSPEEECSNLVLRAVAKHFVTLTFKESKQGRLCHASCFVIEVEGEVVLITAGHVINEIREGLQRGIIFSEFMLHDKTAGNDYSDPTPYDFNIDNWLSIHDELKGMDYAGSPLSPIFSTALLACGVIPLKDQGWGNPSAEYDDFFIVGIPTETMHFENDIVQLNLHLTPIEHAEIPVDHTRIDGFIYAKFLRGNDSNVRNVAGMSGSPVFGVIRHEDRLSYWVIGIQSSWLPESRVLLICPVLILFESLKTILMRRNDIAN